PDVHIVDRYFKTARKLGVRDDRQGLDFVVRPADRTEAASYLPDRPFVAMAIGAGLNTKCLEVDQIHHLAADIRYPVVLLGGPDDQAKGEQIARELDGVVNLAGVISLGASAAVVDQAGLLITPDTGLMHIAAALDKPVISVWGNTVPKFGMTPLYRQDSAARHALFEIGALPCRPCSKIGYDACPKGHFKCIRELPLPGIVSLVHDWLEGA
ncbi:MAG: glycosyltransferase family 9 protein, partial [Saprospiraceae bacterium]|nr:glycosyltransferase family 9 protein [Saprospiraceae bacterium]